MRTKALLGLAALAVGLSTSVAQNVYSLNVVGYVNVSLQNQKLHFLSVPLETVDGNYAISNTMNLGASQVFASLFKWDVTNQKWADTVPTWDGTAWDVGSMVISNGTGFFLVSQADSTLTFVGQVPQGTIPYNIPLGLATLANKIPVSTNFPGQDIGNVFDSIFTWDQTHQKWADAVWTYDGTQWDLSPKGPVLNPSEALFYVNGTAAIPFTRTFTVAP